MWCVSVYYGVCGDSSACWVLRGGQRNADCSHKWRGSWPAANHLWACPLSSTASTRRARLPNILIFRLKQDTLSATVLARAILRINREISFNLKKKVDYWFCLITINEETRWRVQGLCDTWSAAGLEGQQRLWVICKVRLWMVEHFYLIRRQNFYVVGIVFATTQNYSAGVCFCVIN